MEKALEDGATLTLNLAPAPAPPASSEDEKRKHIIGEILSSDKSYLKALELCLRHYLLPLRALLLNGSPLLKEAKLKQLFGNIEDIV